MNPIAEIDRLLESSPTNVSPTNNLDNPPQLSMFNDTIKVQDKPKIDFNLLSNSDDDQSDTDSESNIAKLEKFPTPNYSDMLQNVPSTSSNNMFTQPPTNTDSFSQTEPQPKINLNLNSGFSNDNVHTGFNYDEFNRRIIFKVIQNDTTIGDHLKDMAFDFKQADREALEYFRKIICTIDDMKFSNNIEVKNCYMLIELFRSIVKMAVPEDYESVCDQIEAVQEIIKSTDYTISIINEVASMRREDLLSTRSQPIKRTMMLLGQTLMSIFVKKAPKIMQKLSDKYYAGKRKATIDAEEDLPFGKKMKF